MIGCSLGVLLYRAMDHKMSNYMFSAWTGAPLKSLITYQMY